MRLQMVKAATEGQHGFRSMTVKSAAKDRHIRWIRWPPCARNIRIVRVLIVGMDAFLGLPKWYQWREILQLSHSGGCTPTRLAGTGHGTARRAAAWTAVRAASVTCTNPAPDAIYIHAVERSSEISSTEVRNLVAAGRDPRFLMPDSVRRIILESRCYTAPER